MWPRLASNLRLFGLSAGITGVCRQARLFKKKCLVCFSTCPFGPMREGTKTLSTVVTPISCSTGHERLSSLFSRVSTLHPVTVGGRLSLDSMALQVSH